MATVKVTSTRDIGAAIRYAGSGEMHTKHEGIPERVLAKSSHMVNVNDATFQMKSLQNLYGKGDGTYYVQGYRITQSFSKDELNPKNPEDWKKANEIGLKFAKKLYGKHQFVVYTHADGETGCLHNHIIVNAVDMDGKSLRGIATRSFKPLAKKHDAFLKENNYKQTLDKYNYEKAYKTHDEYNDYVQREYVQDALHGAGELKSVDVEREDFSDHITNGEHHGRNNGTYLWKDDLRERLVQAVADPNVTDMNKYEDKLDKDHDVQLEYATRRNKKVLRYRFTDMNGKKHKIQASSLGDDYTEEALDEYFRQSQQENAKRIEQQRLIEQQQRATDERAIDELEEQSNERAISELEGKYSEQPTDNNHGENGLEIGKTKQHDGRDNADDRNADEKAEQKAGWQRI